MLRSENKKGVAHQAKRQLDDSIRKAGLEGEAGLLPANGEEDVVGRNISLSGRGSTVGIWSLGVGDVSASIDVGEFVVIDLETRLDLDVAGLCDGFRGKVLQDS